MIGRLMIAAALLAPLPLQAQDAGQDASSPPKRVRSILLYGDDKCPKSTDPDEVVVCAKVGESPYRIPKRFRNQPAEGPAGQSWARRAEDIEDVSRIGRPGSCSPVGSGGQTGCTRQMIQQWAQERVEQRAKQAREQGPETDDSGN